MNTKTKCEICGKETANEKAVEKKGQGTVYVGPECYRQIKKTTHKGFSVNGSIYFDSFKN